MSLWSSLLSDFTLVGFIVAGWALIEPALVAQRLVRGGLFGLLMGVGAAISMLTAEPVIAGVVFDLRMPLVALGALFGGPLSAMLAFAIAAVVRFFMGGAGAPTGVIFIGVAAVLGLAGNLWLRGRPITILQAVQFGLLVGLLPLGSILSLPDSVRSMAVEVALLPMVALNGLGATLTGTIMAVSRRRNRERRLLLAALHQAPDYLYVKDTESRFIAANRMVAEHNGFSSPAQMAGLTDRDIAAGARAEALIAEERGVMRDGEPLLDHVEYVDTEDGGHWFLTSKLPVRDTTGEVIGLVGATRDITASKKAERDVLDSRNQLAFVLREMSDGVALFTRDGTIVMCNERYRNLFPRTSDIRVPGASLKTILRTAIDIGEQIDILPNEVDEWIDGVVGALTTGGEEEVHLFDGRWLSVRTTPVADGGATVIVSDITTLKRAEIELTEMTMTLQQLATTDGLTGLLNRRAFDEMLEREMQRARRRKQDTSLVLIDVDRFKAFNDLYGHPAGDECLRAIARVLRSVVRRPPDAVARYGGEEFCVILPDTGEDGAFKLAEQMRLAVAELALEHGGSEMGHVTISLGVATAKSSDDALAPLELVSRADEALYVAKRAGRNRLMGWRRNQTASAA